MNHAVEAVLGDGIGAELALFALLAAFAAATPAIYRRWAALCLAGFLLLWSPLTAPLVAANLTGPDTYFRVLWIVPLYVSMAAVLSAPLELRSGQWSPPRWLAISTSTLAAVLVLGLAPASHTLSADNRVRIDWPGPKPPPAQLEAARGVASHAGPGELVLAPPLVSRWIPLLHHHPSPLVVREMYLDVLHPRLGGAELDRRTRLTYLVGGELRLESGDELLAEAIDAYPLAVVCLGGRALAWPELRQTLRSSPLEVQSRNALFEVWARPAAQGSD